MKAPVSSLSVSSCFSSTVTAWSQSTAAISTSVVLFMYTLPKKSVARKPGGKETERELERRHYKGGDTSLKKSPIEMHGETPYTKMVSCFK